MIAICRHATAESLVAPDYWSFYTDRSPFDVTPGVAYTVYGVGVFRRATLILVNDDWDKPSWLPEPRAIAVVDAPYNYVEPEADARGDSTHQTRQPLVCDRA